MRSYWTLGFCGLLPIFTTNTASGQPASPVPASYAWVRAENDGAGTGFVFDADKKLLVTCRHLVAERSKVDVIFPWYREGKLVAERREYLGNRVQLRDLGLLVTGKIIKTSNELDLALVQLESLPRGIRSVTFATNPVSIGDRVHLFGNRLDLDTVWNLTEGPVRATGRLSDGYFWRGKKLAENANAIIAQLPTEEGDSGGPLFNERGELVGMASALRRQCPLAAVAISVAEIFQFAESPQPPKKSDPRQPPEVVESLMRATVWVRPTATNTQLAGILIDKNLVLTCGKGLVKGDRVGAAFPIREAGGWFCERNLYRDPVSLALRCRWRSALVLALDSDRDLALLSLDSTPEFMRPVHLASRLPHLGNRVHAMNHPSGLEFAWVYACGAVRQCGNIAIAPGENSKRIETIVCQLPAQSGSPGGPVLNDRGELVGVLAAKESTQMVGYAVSSEEIAAFLDIARNDRAPRTLAGLRTRIEEFPQRIARAAAMGLAQEGEVHSLAGRLIEAKKNCDKALSLDRNCVLARLCRARMLDTPSALAELDTAIETGNYDRGVLLLRADLAIKSKDWRKARGDLERIVDANPLDAETRQRLVGVLLELNEDAKALTAVSDTLRADPKRMPALAVDLLAQADSLANKFPDAPAIPVDWLTKSLMVAEKAIGDPATKGQLRELLKQSASAKNDGRRLVMMREWLKKRGSE